MYGPPPCRKRKLRMTELVCANVYGFCWSIKLRARMECAAFSSHLVWQSSKTSSHNGFRERRVRPFCHLVFRKQTWQENIKPSSSSWAADVEIALRFPSLA